LGYFLDNYFKTGYWLPILFLVGVGAGFRAMFLVLGRISRQQKHKEQQKQENVRLAPNPNSVVNADDPKVRDRIFQVPPPPIPGQKRVEAQTNEPESVEGLIERLLQDEKGEAKSDEAK